MQDIAAVRCLALAVVLAGSARALAGEDLGAWQPLPKEFKPAAMSKTSVSLHQGNTWAYLRSPQDYSNLEVAATVTIDSPATQFDFFGSSWSAWPDPKFEDRGFEAALLLRGSEDGARGYRVQLSSKYQEVALVRFPDGGYVRSVPCPVETQTPFTLRVKSAGSVIRVLVDGKEVIHYVDRLEPLLDKGRVAVGVSSAARVTFSDVVVQSVDAEATPAPQPHQPRLTFRK